MVVADLVGPLANEGVDAVAAAGFLSLGKTVEGSDGAAVFFGSGFLYGTGVAVAFLSGVGFATPEGRLAAVGAGEVWPFGPNVKPFASLTGEGGVSSFFPPTESPFANLTGPPWFTSVVSGAVALIT